MLLNGTLVPQGTMMARAHHIAPKAVQPQPVARLARAAPANKARRDLRAHAEKTDSFSGFTIEAPGALGRLDGSIGFRAAPGLGSLGATSEPPPARCTATLPENAV